ncbi:srk1 [Candida oxycetoniae]|uniref:Srk1 n=1 Tax=Candida oxycetoniae TaxID=497107 RepID=A0AAI9SUW1_9ASCO|nr:srk1 [Candida oxycetoniae]KAI3403483.1 srk1 [Candida oxycetoniae]
MFENLKAFIRHGKQANDFKKKTASPYEQQQPQQTLTAENPFGSDYQLIDSSDISGKQYQQHQAPHQTHQSHGDEQNPRCGPEFVDHNSRNDGKSVYADAETNLSDITLNDPVQQQQQQQHQHQHQQHQQHQEYNKVATQIVEEERLQKSKFKKYPNLDKYEVMEQMGEGAFSVVYKAVHKATGKEVAIKILRKFQMDQQQKQAVLKEVTIMRQLKNPYIVRFIEFIDSPVYYYIVQELVSGGEIFTMIVKYTYLSEDLSRWIITQVAHAIRYLHEEVGIVHRDIKPENLLFEPIELKPSADPTAKLRKSDDPNTKKDEGEFIDGVGGGGIGVVKLADFGLSKQIWEHNTKTPCGTVGYTAPEIVRDERYSREVDMWAMGCVLYTLLCGFPPFYDERIETLTEKVAKGQFTFLQPWWDEISDGAKNCVSNLLTVDPKKRYTIDDLLRDPWMQTKPKSAAQGTSVLNLNSTLLNTKVSHPIQSQNQGTLADDSASAIATSGNKYSKKYKSQNFNQDLYSPAAVALRDAFDISTAVHRMGEEAALSTKYSQQAYGDLIEEEEEENEEDVTASGRVLHHHKRSPSSQNIRQQQQQQQKKHQDPRVPRSVVNKNGDYHIRNNNEFDLNLGAASIIERRKNKQIPIQTS